LVLLLDMRVQTKVQSPPQLFPEQQGKGYPYLPPLRDTMIRTGANTINACFAFPADRKDFKEHAINTVRQHVARGAISVTCGISAEPSTRLLDYVRRSDMPPPQGQSVFMWNLLASGSIHEVGHGRNSCPEFLMRSALWHANVINCEGNPVVCNNECMKDGRHWSAQPR
jgi:hypothetical protein